VHRLDTARHSRSFLRDSGAGVTQPVDRSMTLVERGGGGSRRRRLLRRKHRVVVASAVVAGLIAGAAAALASVPGATHPPASPGSPVAASPDAARRAELARLQPNWRAPAA